MVRVQICASKHTYQCSQLTKLVLLINTAGHVQLFSLWDFLMMIQHYGPCQMISYGWQTLAGLCSLEIQKRRIRGSGQLGNHVDYLKLRRRSGVSRVCCWCLFYSSYGLITVIFSGSCKMVLRLRCPRLLLQGEGNPHWGISPYAPFLPVHVPSLDTTRQDELVMHAMPTNKQQCINALPLTVTHCSRKQHQKIIE